MPDTMPFSTGSVSTDEGGRVAPQILRNFVGEAEAIDSQVADLKTQRKEIMTAAKAKGVDVKAFGRLLRNRRRNKGEVNQEDEKVQAYQEVMDGADIHV